MNKNNENDYVLLQEIQKELTRNRKNKYTFAPTNLKM